MTLVTVYHGTPNYRPLLEQREIVCSKLLFTIRGEHRDHHAAVLAHEMADVDAAPAQHLRSGQDWMYAQMCLKEFQRVHFVWFYTKLDRAWSSASSDNDAPAVLELGTPIEELVELNSLPDMERCYAGLPLYEHPVVLAPLRVALDGRLRKVHVQRRLTGLVSLLKSYPGVELVLHDRAMPARDR